MKNQKHTPKIKLRRPGQRLRIIMVALVMVVGTALIGRSLAAPAAHIYISPSAATKLVGETFAVQVRVRTTSPINAAFVNMSYNGSGLQVVSVQRGANFPNQNGPTEITANTIKMQSTRNNSATGDFHYATVTFRALRTGSFNFDPQTSSFLVNYPQNEVAFSLAGASYAIITPPPPVQPQPTPTPTPTPPSTPVTPPKTPTTPKTPTATTPKPVAPTTSAPSASNLQISNFAITADTSYRKVVLSWTTNAPSSSKANFGSSVDNMSQEVSDPAKATTHQLVIQGNTLRAGKKYAVRITSDDGAGPVTIDGTFSTKAIPISVKVADTQGQPVSGVAVSTDIDSVTTNDDGISVLGAPEGSIGITAKKDDLTTEITASINLPESDSEAPQEISLVLGASSSENSPAARKQGLRNWQILLLVVFVGIGLVYIVLLIRRKRKQAKSHYFGANPDLGFVPTGGTPQAPPNSLPPSPTITPSSPPPSYSSLPELVRQDLQSHRKRPAQTDEEPQDMFTPLDRPAIQVKHQPNAPAEPKKSETPSHTKEKDEKEPKHTAEKPKEHPEHPEHRKQVEIDPKDHSLRIHHDED